VTRFISANVVLEHGVGHNEVERVVVEHVHVVGVADGMAHAGAAGLLDDVDAEALSVLDLGRSQERLVPDVAADLQSARWPQPAAAHDLEDPVPDLRRVPVRPDGIALARRPAPAARSRARAHRACQGRWG
jgi:hypothetical protein